MAENNVKKMYEYFSTHKNDKGNAFFGGTYDEFRESLADNNVRLNMYNHLSQANIFKGSIDEFDNELGFAQPHQIEQVQPQQVEQQEQPQFEYVSNQKKGFGQRAKDAVWGGTLKLGAGIIDAMSRFGAAQAQADAYKYGGLENQERVNEQVTQARESLNKGEGIGQKYLGTKADAISEENQQRYGYNEDGSAKGATDLIFRDKKVLLGLEKAFMDGLASAPTTVVALAGPAGLVALGAGSAEQKYEQLKSEQPEMSEGAMITNAVLTGAFESATEYIGKLPILRNWKLFKDPTTEEVLREQIERLGQSWVKKYVGGTLKSLSIQMGQEALEEATNAIAGMALDKVTGVERDYSIDEVIDAAMAGAMGGATGGSALSSVGMGVGAYRQRKGRKAMVEYNEAYNVALEQMGGQYNQWEASLDESVDKTALRQTLGNLATQYANGSLSRADLRAELINMGVKPSQMPTDSELLGLLAIEQGEADGSTGWFAGGRKSKELKLSAYLNGYYGAGAQEEILGFMRQNNLSQEQFVDLMTNNKPTAEQVGLRNKFYESMEGHREAQQLRYKFLNKFCEENGVTEDQLDMMLQRRAQGIELKDWELELSNRFDEAMSNYEHENKIKATIDGKAQIAVDLIRRQTNNSNGRLQNVRVGNEEAPSIIKQGNVSILMNKEGKLYIDEQNSDDVVVVANANGENARQVGIKELTPLFDGLAKEVQGMAVESIERGVRNADTFTQGTMIALPNGQAGIVQSVGEDGSIAMFDFQGNPITIAPQDTENARKVTFTEGMNVGGVTIEGVQEDGYLIVNGSAINPSEFASGIQQYLYDSAGQTPKAPIVTPQQAQEVQTNAASVQLQQDIADAKELGDDFVNTMLTQAQKSLDKASKQKPTGTDANSYRASKNKIDAQVAQAQAEVDRWLAVQQALAQEQIQNTINNEQNESPKVENANQVGNVARDKFVNSKRFEGNTSVRTLPNGTQIKGRYMLVSAESLTPSHNPLDNWNTSEGFPLNERGQNINDRDYKNDVSAQNETMRIAQQYGGQAVEQVPTVSPEGVVYDGNGRTMAGIIAAQNGTDASYIETLKANASNFGFTPQQVNEIPSARVVFVTDEVLPYTTQTFAQFNQQEKKTQSSTENAVAKSKSLDTQTISQLLSVVDSYVTLDSFFTSPIACADMLKVLQEKGIIAPTEVAGLTETNKNGELVFNAHGREFITDVLIGANFTENVIRQMAGDKGLKQSVLRALNVIIANRKLGEFALTKHINNAISLIREANNAKLSVSLYLRQTNMFEALATERYTAFEILIAEQLQSGVENFRELLSKYNNYARENQGGQTDMFAEGGLLSIEDITNIILEQYGHRTTQTEHAIQSSSRGENRANEEGIRERRQGNSEQQPNDTIELERKLLHLKEGESIKDFFERLKKTKQPILNRIQEWQNKVGVPVEVIISPLTIKNKIAYNEIAKGTNVKGWYDPNTGKAYIYLPNAESVKDVDETVMHEIIAHKGLRELLGKEKFDELCDAVWDMMSEKQRAEKLAYLNSTGAHRNATQQERQRAAADEYIAFLAENVQLKEDLTVWKSVVRKIKDILKSLGIKFRMSDEQLGELLRESARMFRDNARNESQNNEQDNAAPQFTEVNFRITYHGSGAKFDKFDRFAQRSGLMPNRLGVKGIYVSDSEEVGTNYALTNRYRGEGKSHLYKVEIPDDRGWNYIHWESKNWKSFLRDVNKELEWYGYRAIDKSEVHSNYRPNDKGVVFEVLRRKLGYDTDLLTRYLRKMGIVGISYPSYYEDKNADKNARSYVIFDENDLEIKDEVSFRITPAEDKAYMDAVERGDMNTAQKMVDDAAEKTGYNSDTAYQGSLAFNGSAPSSNAYFETKEARKEAWQNGEYEDTMSLGDFVDSGIDTNDLEWQLNDPRATMNEKLFTIESIRNLRNTVRSGKRTIKMYRAVDANIKENSFRNGDWITPSRRYAKEHVTLQDWKRSRIIEQEVSIDDIWWNGDDINEWGYDDGKDYGYQNTKNNRKLLDAVTYDDNGNVIPLSKRFNKRNEDVRFRVTPEMEDIKAKAKADGTFMLAPNGQPTNLNEKQWLQVRTDAFKKWFGDWKKTFRIEKLRNSEPISVEFNGEYELNRDSAKQWMKDNLRGKYTNEDTGEEIFVVKDGIQKVTSHSMGNDAHIKSLVGIPKMIKNAIFIDEMENKKGTQHYTSYRYYVVGVKVDGVDYTAKLTIGVDEYGNKYYDHSLTEIEKGKLIDEVGALSTTLPSTNNFTLSEYKDTKLISILQTNSSKILDANGEPKVMYHGTPNKFNIFNQSKIERGNGFWFTSELSEAESYAWSEDGDGNIISVFLNAKNPATLNEVNGGLLEEYRKEVGAKVSPEVFIRDKQASDYMRSKGYDALMFDDKVIVYKPNQIKSATENEGGYSEDNNDIRFRITPESTPIFISNALVATQKIKQEKATPQQWLAMIEKNAGIKAGEDKWLGLSDWLKSSTAKTLTKDEVLEYIRENMIDVQEVWYGEDTSDDTLYYEQNLMSLANENEKWQSLQGEFEDLLAEKLDALQQKYDEDYLWENYNKLHNQTVFDVYASMVAKYGDDFRESFKVWDEEPVLTFRNPAKFAEYLGIDISTPSEQQIHDTRAKYTTRGLDNKKEVALTVPTIDSWNQYDTIHFGDAGDGRAVAWVRFGETTDEDGNRVLVIDEIQSKRHQEGREEGYTPHSSMYYIGEIRKLENKRLEMVKEGRENSIPFDELLNSESYQQVLRELREAEDNKIKAQEEGKIPDAPFEKNWQELAMKRMMRYATENGFDKLAWTKGEQQAKRYALSNTVEVIHAEDSLSEMEDGTEIKKEIAITTTQDSIIRLYVDANGNVLSGEFKGKHLSEIVGKDVASRLMADGEVTLEPMNLEIGGEGMKGFYDKMLPLFVNKYGKKWGVKVGEVTLPYVEEAGRTMHSIDITDTMKEQLDAEAQPMFRVLANPAALVEAPKPNEVGHENETFMEYLQRYEQWRNDKIAYENYTESEIPQFPSWDKDRMTFKQYLNAINDYKRGVEKLELVSAYNQAFFTKWKEFKEAMKTLVDTGHRIRAFYKWMKSQGADIDPKDNAYNDSHRRNSRMQHVLRVFEQNQKLNMMNAMNAILRSGKLDGLGFTWQNIDSDTTPAKERRNGTPLTRQEILSVYAQAKDCKEAKELGLPDRGENAFKNNLGMSYQDVIDAVEGAVDPRMIYNLWDAIKAVNDFALDYQLKYGMIDQATRDSLDRKYYVPERGWKVRDMDGKIDGYMPSKNGSKYSSFNPALVKAHGRTSLASDPFPYMLSIAHSSVVATEKNRTLQALYRGLMKNERLGRETGAYKIRRIWGMIAKDENGNTIYDREGKPITLISYEAPTAEMYKHDKEIDEQVKELRKENSKLRDEYVKATPTRQAEINQEVSDNNAKIKKLEESKYMTAMIEDTTIKYRTKNETQQHIIKLKVDGADVEIEFKDEKLANAINGGNWVSNMNDGWMKNTISRISKLTQKLSSWKTQYNYEFAVANFARDLILSHMINGIREGEVFALKASKEVFASMGTIASYLSNGKNLDKMKDSKRKQYLQEFLENGALTGFSFTKPIEDISEELYKELMQLDGDNRTTQEKVARLKNLFAEKGENALAFLSELSEMSVRFAQYVTCRDAGKTIEASATSAKEITTNFDRKSQLGNAFGWVYGFFNAAIQGTINIAYAVKDNPKRGAAMLSAWSAIFVGLGYAMASLFAPDDPEDETYLTEWDRWTNLTIPLPGKNTIVIPLPHVMRAFNALGVNMAMVEKGRKPLNQAIGDVVQFFLDELTPSSPLQIQNFADYNDRTGKWEMDFVKYAQGAMPTFIQPVMDVVLDRNFMNEPIAKRVWNDNIADIHRANAHTEQFFIDFTHWFNKKSGGDPNMETKYKGIDINPSNIKHILTGYGGGLPQLIIDTGMLIYNTAKGNDIQTGEIPFLRKVVRTYDDKKAYTNEYWDLKNKVDKYKATLEDAKKNSKDTYRELKDSDMYDAYKKAERILKKVDKPKKVENPSAKDINDMIWANKMMNKGKVVEKPE